MTHQQFALKDIQPNPFRALDHYPIKQEKVEALITSIDQSGFWDNVVARVRPDGKPELAYGHHRLVALREKYAMSHKVDLIVKDLDDTTMLKMMVAENAEEWGTAADITHESIRAVVQAYADGRIELGPVDEKTRTSYIRYAPSFIPGQTCAGHSPAHPYTSQTLAEFLGWTEDNGRPKRRVENALVALQYIEEGRLKASQFEGMGSSAAEAVISQARKAARAADDEAMEATREAEKAEREAAAAKDAKARAAAEERQREAKARATKAKDAAIQESRKVGRAVSEAMRGGGGVKDAPAVAATVATPRPKAARPPKELEHFATQVLKALHNDWSECETPPSIYVKLRELAALKDTMSPLSSRNLKVTLTRIATLTAKLASEFDTANTGQNGASKERKVVDVTRRIAAHV